DFGGVDFQYGDLGDRGQPRQCRPQTPGELRHSRYREAKSQKEQRDFMRTVNFHCGHCGNLMAVEEKVLGQQVCCPHCQQIVLAVAPSPSAGDCEQSPTNLTFNVPSPEEQESI